MRKKADPEGDKVIGLWLTGSKRHIYKSLAMVISMAGKIVWLRDPNEASGKPKLDSKNPDEKSRKATMLGLNNLLGFKRVRKKENTKTAQFTIRKMEKTTVVI